MIELLEELRENPISLIDIELVVSKQDNTTMNGETFRKNLLLEPNQDISNLSYDDYDDEFLVFEIDIQWYVFRK
ncbi:hypothetical protein [Mammaliicoccus vitulinus]|uniref:hypothetical protein n=1 Tax=Mammaliicoccus vitulinus TaxID=71237 RepID=UPI00248C1966|nr:hypothetical protein [Mammaliicoccus vitulinus]